MSSFNQSKIITNPFDLKRFFLHFLSRDVDFCYFYLNINLSKRLKQQKTAKAPPGGDRIQRWAANRPVPGRRRTEPLPEQVVACLLAARREQFEPNSGQCPAEQLEHHSNLWDIDQQVGAPRKVWTRRQPDRYRGCREAVRPAGGRRQRWAVNCC